MTRKEKEAWCRPFSKLILPTETKDTNIIFFQRSELKLNVFFKKKMGQPRTVFHLFSTFQTHITFLQQINVKNVHPVYSDGIRTHYLWNISLLR